MIAHTRKGVGLDLAPLGVGLIGEQRPGERRFGVRANHRGGFGACGERRGHLVVSWQQGGLGAEQIFTDHAASL